MKLDNYKNIKKTEWLEISKQFGIESDSTSGVRYLVEKIAEKIGVDDKIVSDNELKKQVVEKINSEYDFVAINETEEKPKKETKPKATTKRKTTTTSKQKEPVITKVKSKEEVEEKKPQLSKLESLRLECESYGIAWTDKHSEQNLEQVLSGVKGAGIQPTNNSNTPTLNSTTSIDTQQPFEINSGNVQQVKEAISNAPNPAINPLSQIKQEPVINGGYSSTNSYLKTYQDIYLNAIRSHWRVLSVSEINEMISRDNHSFSHEIVFNPQQGNKIEIILKQGVDTERIPSNPSDWIDING
jgi:vacuolar-type H+-ATPase subunit I/STV1